MDTTKRDTVRGCRKSVLAIIKGKLRPDECLAIDRELCTLVEQSGVDIMFKDESIIGEYHKCGTTIRINAATITGEGPYWYELENATSEYNSCDMNMPMGFETIEKCREHANDFLEKAQAIMNIIMNTTKGDNK